MTMKPVPPVEAYQMFKRRYADAKSAGTKLDVPKIASGVSTDYLNVYSNSSWSWSSLRRAILSQAGTGAQWSIRRKKAARRRVERDTGGQQYLQY